MQCGKGKHIPDVSDIAVNLEIDRFEQALFKIDTNNFEQELREVEQRYPEFSDIYFNNLLGSRDTSIAPNGHAAYVKGFVQFGAVQKLFDTINIVYKDFEKTEAELKQLMQFYQYHFPDATAPKITTYLSEYTIMGFNYGENAIGIGLDYFLGPNYPYFQLNQGNPNFSAYITRTLNPDYLSQKVAKLLLQDKMDQPKGRRLLDNMIHLGKELYATEQLLPYAQDSVVTEFTPENLQWFEENERELWAYFLGEDLLYSTELSKIRKLVDYSPSGNTDMPANAPGRSAAWMGRQIIYRYMKRYPETSLQELLAIEDAQDLLTKSKYKPL